MTSTKNEALLADNRVQEEIARHRWLESEKAGSDIGFERAAKDWLMRFSDDWIKFHLAQKSTNGRSSIKVVREVTKTGRGKS